MKESRELTSEGAVSGCGVRYLLFLDVLVSAALDALVIVAQNRVQVVLEL